MDVVYDNYEPATLSMFDHIFGFFSGVRQKGLQTTEEILREGSFITAVGELELDGDQMRLQPSSVGPMFLSTATKNTLLKKMEEAKSSMM
jgi:E3 ubiquitin-protein ligase MUL1